MQLNVVGISGSLRRSSYNGLVLKFALEYARELGHTVDIINLADLELPLYNADLDTNEPSLKVKLDQLIHLARSANIFLIAAPEYDHAISAALKNMFEWLSTNEEEPMSGKVAAIFGTSSGMFGTVRGQAVLRQILAALNVLVLPKPEVFIRFNQEAFNDRGELLDPKTKTKLKELVEKTLRLTQVLRAANFS